MIKAALAAVLLFSLSGCGQQLAAASSPAGYGLSGETFEMREDTGRVEVSFEFARQKGFSTNQFAVWIEDEDARPVKTLFATRFTASGGWKKRAEALPEWVSRYDAEQDRLDAAAGATPRSGEACYVWDCTDESGAAVEPGEYRVMVEGTLRKENRVLYAAPFTIPAEETSVGAQARYFGEDDRERGMIGAVTVRFYPKQ